MRTVVNIASSYARYLLGLLAVAWLTPYILGQVGVNAYGLWALCLAMCGMLGLLDLGFTPGTAIRGLRRAPLGDPSLYELRGMRLCLRRAEAHWIRVVSE